MDQNVQNYKIKRETMTLIADKLRRVVGKTTPLTPAEIAYYIERIIFTPQSYATTNFKIQIGQFSSAITGRIPEIPQGIVNDIFDINANYFTTDIIGLLPEIQESIAEGILSITSNNFNSIANGLLQE